MFLKDISKQTIIDLITYIYCGEVNVKQECFDSFMNAAQALNIKGLNESNGFQSLDSQPSVSTSIEQTFSESSYPTPNLNHRFGSTGVQCQSVQRSAKLTIYQQPIKEYQTKDNINFDNNNQINGGFGQDSFNYYDGSSSNIKKIKSENDALFDQWNSEFDTGFNNNEIQTVTTAPKHTKSNIGK